MLFGAGGSALPAATPAQPQRYSSSAQFQMDAKRGKALSTNDIPRYKPAAITSELVETGLNHRKWKTFRTGKQDTPKNQQGNGGPGRPGSSLVEICTGMNYWDGQAYVPSVPEFDIAIDGFSAEKLQYKVHLSANIHEQGAVRVLTRDGQTLRSTPVAIELYDAKTGRSQIIGQIRDSDGALIEKNQVLYADAFDGVSADVLITINKGTFEQDILVTERIDPQSYGFSPDHCRLRVIT